MLEMKLALDGEVKNVGTDVAKVGKNDYNLGLSTGYKIIKDGIFENIPLPSEWVSYDFVQEKGSLEKIRSKNRQDLLKKAAVET